MNDVDTLVRQYLQDCTPAEMTLRELSPGQRSQTHGRPRASVAVLAAVAAAVLLVVGVVIAREQVDPTETVAPPAVDVVTSDSADLLGTWVVLGQASADPADLERQVRMTFLSDGTWSGWDGCNSIAGTYRVNDVGVLRVAAKSSTLVACTKQSDIALPLDQDLTFETGSSRITLSNLDANEVSVLWRPGGQYNPTAQMLAAGAEGWRLKLTTWGGGGCPFIPSDVTFSGENQLTVDSRVFYKACDTSLVGTSRSTSVDPSQIEDGSPVTVTLNGLYSAPVTVPVDMTAVDGNSGPMRTFDVGVVLVDMPPIGSEAEPTLVTYPTTVESTGDIGWDAVNALFTTVASDGKAVNGFNLGHDGRYPAAAVNSVVVGSDMITVDIDRNVWDPYPTADGNWPGGEVVMQQLVWTLHGALGTDLPVLLTVDGEPARGIWFHRLDGPVAAEPAMEPAR